jgi:DNA-binding response OmpR family regulator
MPYAIVVDDELEPMEQPPGRRGQVPESLKPDADPHGALALLDLIHQLATPRIRVDHYWNPREAKARILEAEEAPLVLVLDIINERDGIDTRVSATSDRCGLALAALACQKWPQTPIIFLTQLDSYKEELSWASEVPSYHDYITKRTVNTKALLRSRLGKLFSRYLEQVLESGVLRLDSVRVKVYWREFELGTIATKTEYPQLTQDLNLRSTRLTPDEFALLQCVMSRALEIWSKPGKVIRATITFENMFEDLPQLADDTILKHIGNIRKKLEKLFAGKRERAHGVFVNAKRAYIFTERANDGRI